MSVLRLVLVNSGVVSGVNHELNITPRDSKKHPRNEDFFKRSKFSRPAITKKCGKWLQIVICRDCNQINSWHRTGGIYVMAKIKPRLFTPAGCAAVGKLLEDCLQKLNLNTHSAERWIAERVELPDGMRELSCNTIRGVIKGVHPTFRPETLEILCASGIFDPLTRDEVWDMACEIPNENAGSDHPSLPAQLELIAQSLQDAIAEVGRMKIRLAIPLDPPRDRIAAIALFQAILHQNFAGWTAEQIAARFSVNGDQIKPWRVQSWIEGRSLPTSAEILYLGLEGLRLRANDAPLTDQWLDSLSEEWWARAHPIDSLAAHPLVDQVG